MSTSIDPDERASPVGTLFPEGAVGVDGRLINDLAISYSEYRQAVASPFDPVITLALTGDILNTVRRILATIGPASAAVTPRKAGQ